MLRALLFDLDGTLTDSDPVHLAAFNAMLAMRGASMTEEEFRATISGKSNDEIARALLPEGNDAERLAFTRDKEAMFRRMASDLAETRGLARLLAWADARALKLAIVSNAPADNVVHMTTAIGVADRFHHVIHGDSTPRPKPDPLPYLSALAHFGLSATEAIAFEDSVPGIRSAAGAGLDTVAIAGLGAVEPLKAAGATIAVRDFEDEALWAFIAGRE
jgi:beta-phosphoglucomutase-like phosphatase (HAD superfamily)